MASYLLLSMRRWASKIQGPAFQLGERTAWKAELNLARVDPGSSVTVDLEASPTGLAQDYAVLATFGAKSAVGRFILDSTATPTPDFKIDRRRDVWVRAVISSLTGSVVAEVSMSAPFILPTRDADSRLLIQELREWKDGLKRTLAEAESAVAEVLTNNPSTGELDLDLSDPAVHGLIQLEIADQAAHLMRRALLAQDHSPSAIVTLRSMPRLFSGLGVRLRKYRFAGTSIWYGR